MKHLSTFAMLLFLSFVSITGCKKDENPAGSNQTPTATQPSAPTPTSFNGNSPTNVMALIRTTSIMSVPGVGNVATDASAATAVFGSPGTDKGTVTIGVSGSNYVMGKLTNSGAVSYIFPDVSNPTSLITLSASATNASFSVSGFSAVNGSVTVPGRVTLTAPAANATVARNSALNVTWSVSGGAGSRHAIFIADAQGHSVFKDGAANGSGSFTTGELGGLSAGTAWVYALTYNFTLVNSNQGVIIGEAVALNQITLQ